MDWSLVTLILLVTSGLSATTVSSAVLVGLFVRGSKRGGSRRL